MDVVCHQAKRVQFEVILLLGFVDSVQKDFSARGTIQIEAAVVTADGNVIGRVRSQSTFLPSHWLCLRLGFWSILAGCGGVAKSDGDS